MKAIIEFTLPEDYEEHTRAMNGIRYHAAMLCFNEFLRSRSKCVDLTEEAREELEAIRAEWWETSKGLLDD